MNVAHPNNAADQDEQNYQIFEIYGNTFSTIKNTISVTGFIFCIRRIIKTSISDNKKQYLQIDEYLSDITTLLLQHNSEIHKSSQVEDWICSAWKRLWIKINSMSLGKFLRKYISALHKKKGNKLGMSWAKLKLG